MASRLDRTFGTDQWRSALLKPRAAQGLFEGGSETSAVDLDRLALYVVERLRSLFPAVAPRPLLLRTARNSPLFLLCFAVANPSKKAQTVALRIARHLLRDTPFMALASPIDWTDATWNPVTGCDKVSPGCTHCYAERMATRLAAMGQANYARGFELTLQPGMLELPLRWRKSRRIFVNSMSDLFHDEVPLDYVRRVFDVMQRASWHEFQVLTKRAERLAQVATLLPWPRNVWMGVSVESEKFVARIDALRTVPAAVRFLSLEPLLGPLPALDWRGIDWAIVGGESGPGARPLDPAWVRDLRLQCRSAGVPFFFKQWGGVRKKATGRTLDGRTWDELPTARVDRTHGDGCVASNR